MLAQLINTSTQTTIHLDALRLDGGTQPRDGLNTAYVTELAQSLQDGAAFPPIDVMHDGQNYWLFDGFHRVAAHRQANILTIPATIHQGDQAAAQWRSYAANQTHGLRRTNDDKKRAILAALRHPNAATLSNREIGRHLDVDHKTIATYREHLQSTGEIPSQTLRTGADGRAIDTTNIGIRPAPVCYIDNNDALFERANATYSAHLMANGKNRILKPFTHDGKLWLCVGVKIMPKQKTAECIRVHEPGDAVSNGEHYPAYLKDAFLGRKVLCNTATYYLGAQWLIIRKEITPAVQPLPARRPIEPPAPTDPWITAWTELHPTEYPDEKRKRLSEAMIPWALAWKDNNGRTWRDVVDHNPQHANSPFRHAAETECRRRGLDIQGHHMQDVIRKLFFRLINTNPITTAPTIQPVDDRPLPAWAQPTTDEPATDEPIPPDPRPTQLNTWWLRLVTLRSELGDWCELTGRHTDTFGIVRELNKLIDITQAELALVEA